MSKLHISFEIKSMRGMFWVPLIAIILCFLYFIYLTSNQTLDVLLALPTFEFIIVPLSSWWITYLFYDYYENHALEVLLSYPVSEAEHGFFRILFFILLYTLSTLFLIGYIVMFSDASLSLLLLQYVPQYLFFAGLSFLCMTLFQNIGVALTVLAFYTATEFLTGGQLIPWYHVFFYNEDFLDFSQIVNKSVFTLAIGLILIKLGGYFLKNIRHS
ncbi:hypothetical protein [Paraliobacillus sp. JSM ZJ581]|uniref:hypothetical protein n=1 Tax=Paraliobacillus sp. JSM ZJ581 TaxID=3342118 RepID=UPI0035A98D63